MSEPTAGQMLLTVFLKHRQSVNLAEINHKLESTGFWKKFPPEGVEVVSWYVMMGIGQVVTLRLPAEQLRAVNLAIEQNAVGRLRDRVLPDLRLPPGLAGDQGARMTAGLTLAARNAIVGLGRRGTRRRRASRLTPLGRHSQVSTCICQSPPEARFQTTR